MRTTYLLCAGLLVLVACGERLPGAEQRPADEHVAPPSIFVGLPLLPGSRYKDGSANAAEAVVEVPAPADSVARFYRQVLSIRAWDIRGDSKGTEGEVTLHARSPEGRPIWIIVRPAGPARASVSLIATAPDSTASPR